MNELKEKLLYVFGVITGEIKTAKIPKILHRIWVGGKMDDTAYENLLDFQERLKTSDYQHILWTTKSTLNNGEFAKQAKLLAGCGIQIRCVEAYPNSVNIDAGVKTEIENLMEKKEYKFVSDLWRLYILYKEGGVYMDVDIGVGQETFQDTLYHRYQFKSDKNSYLPLLGSAFPFVAPAKDDIFDYLETERKKYGDGFPWNYFYASVKENNVILEALLELLYQNTDAQSATINMTNSFYEDIGERDGSKLFAYAFAPLRLQYATQASTEKEMN